MSINASNFKCLVQFLNLNQQSAIFIIPMNIKIDIIISKKALSFVKINLLTVLEMYK